MAARFEEQASRRGARPKTPFIIQPGSHTGSLSPAHIQGSGDETSPLEVRGVREFTDVF